MSHKKQYIYISKTLKIHDHDGQPNSRVSWTGWKSMVVGEEPIFRTRWTVPGNSLGNSFAETWQLLEDSLGEATYIIYLESIKTLLKSRKLINGIHTYVAIHNTPLFTSSSGFGDFNLEGSWQLSLSPDAESTKSITNFVQADETSKILEPTNSYRMRKLPLMNRLSRFTAVEVVIDSVTDWFESELVTRGDAESAVVWKRFELNIIA